jgi:hypothetical protein
LFTSQLLGWILTGSRGFADVVRRKTLRDDRRGRVFQPRRGI